MLRQSEVSVGPLNHEAVRSRNSCNYLIIKDIWLCQDFSCIEFFFVVFFAAAKINLCPAKDLFHYLM